MNAVELGWAITSYVSIITVMLITGICFSCFVRPYLRRKRAAAYAGGVYFVVMLALYLIPPRLDNFTAYAIGILAAFLVMYAMDRRNVEQKIFLAVTFFSLRWLSIAMAGKIDSALFSVLIMRQGMAERPWLQYAVYVCMRILNVGISVLFIAVSIYFLNKAFAYKKANMTKRELLMLLMPSLSAMSGYAVLQFYQEIYEQDTGKSLASIHGIYGGLSFLHYLISVISILVMVLVFQNLKARQEENAGQKLMQSQISDMKKHIAEVEKLYQDIRLLRHDMGNHIQTIEHLLDSGDKREAATYTARLRREWQDRTTEIKSGNPVTDVILLEKKKEAEERGIRFASDFHYPEGANISAFDISVILNNALDNSLERANGDSPYISISSYRKNNIFMIMVENSFEGTVELDMDTQLPISTKKGIGHGLGIANIRRVAQMYLGDIAFEQEKGRIVLTAMLQVEE